MDIREKVIEIIYEVLGVEDHKVVDNAEFIDDLEVTKEDVLEVIMAVEEEFTI